MERIGYEAATTQIWKWEADRLVRIAETKTLYQQWGQQKQ